MDPDANLAEQLRLAKSIAEDQLSEDDSLAMGERLADLVLALDGWMTAHGFLPARWREEA
jgi:hypothetical protein